MKIKTKYKTQNASKKFIVTADYQPSAMYSRPDDHKKTRHDNLNDAMAEMTKHETKGASQIELLESRVVWVRVK